MIHDFLFLEFLLHAGNNTKKSTPDDEIQILKEMVIPFEDEDNSISKLDDDVYPDLASNKSNYSYMTELTILNSLNEFIDKTNDLLINGSLATL